MVTRERIQPRSHRVGRARWVCMNRPHWISARTSGRSPRRLICPGHGCAGTRRAPAPELRLVVVLERDGLPALLIPLPPAPPAVAAPPGCAVTAVAAAVPGAQPERRISQARADDHTAGPVAGAGLLLGSASAAKSAPAPSSFLRTVHRLRCRWHSRRSLCAAGRLRTDPADDLLDPTRRSKPVCSGHERGLADAALVLGGPLPLMNRAQVRSRPTRGRSQSATTHSHR